MKKIIFRAFFTIIVISVTLLMLEGVSYFAFTKEEHEKGIKNYLSLSYNQFIDDIAQKKNCSFAATTIGHSMLGFVMRRKEWLPKGCFGGANNIGIESARDLPLVKSEEDFTILVLGGSVAHQLTNYQETMSSNFLQDYLNGQFYPPVKKQFKVLNGAAGAWAQPNQFNMLAMYADRIDGIIVLDGYNESFKISYPASFEQIPAAQQILAYSGRDSYRFKILNMLGSYRYHVSNSFLANSYLMNALYKVQVGIFKNYVVPPAMIDEFLKGNSEDFKLPFHEAKMHALEQYKSYNKKMHLLAKALGIKSIQFLQPTRLWGKVLTNDEKITREFISNDDYKNIEKMYSQLSQEGFPIFSLTEIFKDRKERIYSDHIHYMNIDGKSVGNEIVAATIANQLGQTWKLKNKK